MSSVPMALLPLLAVAWAMYQEFPDALQSKIYQSTGSPTTPLLTHCQGIEAALWDFRNGVVDLFQHTGLHLVRGSTDRYHQWPYHRGCIDPHQK